MKQDLPPAVIRNFTEALEPKQRSILFTALNMFLERNSSELFTNSKNSKLSSSLSERVQQMYLWLIEEGSDIKEMLFSQYSQEELRLENYINEGLNRRPAAEDE